MSRRCWMCTKNVSIYRSKMIEHLQQCLGLKLPDTDWVNWGCPLCGQRFAHLETLYTHLKKGRHDWKKFKVTRAMESM